MMQVNFPEAKHIQKLSGQLLDLATEMTKANKSFAHLLKPLHANHKISGLNLLQYLLLRSKDIRDMQESLHRLGLSSLTNSESHTLYQLLQVLMWMRPKSVSKLKYPCDFESAASIRMTNAETLLGKFNHADRPHIMVTFSEEMISNKNLVAEMLDNGMTIARINCAHDSSTTWSEMIKMVRKAEVKTGKTCKIYMDLAGPKIRINSIYNRKGENLPFLAVNEGEDIQIGYTDHLSKAEIKKWAKHQNLLLVEPKEIFSQLELGDYIYFDDGKFEAKIQSVGKWNAKIKITRISAKKPRLKPENGINIPSKTLDVSPLTDEDMSNLPFICEHADMVGYSFVSTESDIEKLRSEIKKLSKTNAPAIILKIERMAAVENLPGLLLNGMKDASVGVMIARGDLGVEIGFERLSEIQEEILWICEAAHVPVIWATQVLETLNKTGFATRSEITDAAMSGKAECVMLNKGKFITKTIHTLKDILTRQLGHVSKKRYVMRPLNIAKKYLKSNKK